MLEGLRLPEQPIRIPAGFWSKRLHSPDHEIWIYDKLASYIDARNLIQHPFEYTFI